MKIVHLVHGYFPQESGGTQRYLSALVRAQKTAGLAPVILTGVQEASSTPEMRSRVWDDIPVWELLRSGLYLDSWYRSFDPEAEGLIRSFLRDEAPDLVHVHHWRRLSRNLVRLAEEEGIPAVVTLHDVAATCPRIHRIREGDFCERVAGAVHCRDCVDRLPFQTDDEVGEGVDLYRGDFEEELAQASRILSPSIAVSRLVGGFIPRVADAIEVLPHGRLEAPVRSKRKAGTENDPLVVASWGALHPMKGQHLILEALALSRNASRIRVEIWGGAATGESDYENELERLASGLNVVLHGAYPAGGLPRRPGDVAVFPSVAFESHSFALDEALLRGMPVIVSDRGALPERAGAAGVTFEAGRAEDLARRLDELVEDPARLRAMAEAVPRLPTMRQHAAALEKHYRRVLKSKSHASRKPAESTETDRLFLARQMRRRDEQLFELRGKVQGLKDLVAHLKGEVEEREGVIDEKDRTLQEFVENLERLSRTLEQREKEIAEASALLAKERRELGGRIDRRDAALAAKEETLAEFVASTAALQSALEQARTDSDLAQERTREIQANLETEQRLRADEERRRAELEVTLASEREEWSVRERDAAAAMESLRGQLVASKRDAEELASERDGLRAELEGARRSLERTEMLRQRLLGQAEERDAELLLRERALAEALGDLVAARKRYEELLRRVHERLGPISVEVPEPEGLSGTEALLERIVANHGRLHGIVEERNDLLDHLVAELGERASNGGATTDGHASSSVRLKIEGKMAAWRRLGRRPSRSGGRMRILLVVHDFLPKHAAGTEIYTFQLAKQLAQRHDVHLLFCEARHEQARYTISKGVFEGLPYTEVVHNYRWESFEETYHDPKMEEIFETVLRGFRPDLVHIQHLHYFSFGFIPLAKTYGVPVVYTLHEYMLMCARGGQLRREDGEICSLPDPGKCADCIRHETLAGDYGHRDERMLKEAVERSLPDRLKRAFLGYSGPLKPDRLDAASRPIYARAIEARLAFISERIRDVDLFISPSAFLRDRFIESGMITPDRILHSDNGFDLTPWEGFAHHSSSTLRFGFVGTIAEYKGVHVLVEAFEGVEADDVELRIWGDIETFQEYKQRLLPLVRNPRTRFMGRFDNGKIAEVMADLDVLVVPSLWYENSPLTIHEAWLAGIPVICSDIGGMAELVEDGVNGFHFRMGDSADLRRKMDRFIEDRELACRMGKKVGAVKDIRQDAVDMEERYRRLLKGKPVT